MRQRWQWPFAHHLNTPRSEWGRLSVQDTDDGIAYLMAFLGAPAPPE